MTKLSLLLFLLIATLSACAREESNAYCRDHYLYHAEHLADTGKLDIVVTGDGILSSALILPAVIVSSTDRRRDDLISLMRRPESIYSSADVSRCIGKNVAVSMIDDTMTVELEANCHSISNLKQVDVVLFDTIPELQELEITITTPATSKQFAINRQCDAAIFRLGQP